MTFSANKNSARKATPAGSGSPTGSLTVSLLTLAFTGVLILMVHPRLYWGEVGNDLTPALIELPISRNHQHGGWTSATPFFETPRARSAPAGPSTSSIRTAGGGACTSWPAWCLVLPGPSIC